MNPNPFPPDSLAVESKVDINHNWDSWREYLDDAIQSLPQMFAYLPEPQDDMDRRERMLAVWDFIRQAELCYATLGTHEDGGLNVQWALADGSTLLLSEQEGSGDFHILENPQVGSESEGRNIYWTQAFREAERQWWSHHPEAPVLVAHFQGQNSDSPSGDVYQVNGARWQWDATQDMIDTPWTDRNGLMEKDQEQSDCLRDSDRAPDEARNWDGPYWVEPTLYGPSKQLRAQREARLLGKETERSDRMAPGRRI